MTAFRFAFVALCFWSCCGFVQSQTIACEGGSVLIESGTEALTFQWQSSEDDNWTNLEEAPPFFGTSSSGLLIDPAGTLLQGMSFRCLVPSVDSELPDSTAYVTELSVVNSLEPSIIEVGPLSSTSSNCHGDNSVLLLQTVAATGSAGVITTHWQTFSGDSWNTSTAEEVELSLTNLTTTTLVRQVSQATGTCPDTAYSNVLEVNVYDPLTAGSVSGSQQICVDASPDELISVAPSGGSGSYLFQWQSSAEGQNWSDIPGATSLVFASEPLPESTSFRLVVTDANGCGTAVSPEVSIDVFPPLSPATIALDSSMSSGTNCFQDNQLTLIQTAPASGADGMINSQWQQLMDGEWTSLAAPDSSLVLANLTESTSVRLVSTSAGPCGGTVYSNSVDIDVLEPVMAGAVSENQLICYEGTPPAISNAVATGGSSNYAYQWQTATQGTEWTDLFDADSLVFQPSSLTETTFFRMMVSDSAGCGVVFSETLTVNIADPIEAGTLSLEQDSICFGGEFNVFATESSGGIGAFDYEWMWSVDSAAFETVGANALSLTVNDLNADHVEVTFMGTSSGGCGSVNYESVYLEVLPQVAPPSIDFINFNGDSTLCFGNEAPAIMLMEDVSGANGQWTYSWQTSDNDGMWTSAQEDSASFSPGSVSGSFEIRLAVNSDFGCGQFTSNVLGISAYESEIAPVVGLALGDFEICFETSPGAIQTESPPSGGTDIWSYQWQVLVEDNWMPLPGETLDETLIPGLTENESYRLEAQDSVCATVYSNVIDIEVFEPLDDSLLVLSSVSQTLCDVNNGVDLELSIPPAGGGNDFTYAWREQGETIPQETNTSLAIGFVEDSTFFQLVATSTEGCGSITSNVVEVNVFDPLGTFNASEDQVICHDFVPDEIYSIGGFGASGTYSYQWQSSTGSAWTPIVGEQGVTLQLPELTTSLLYRLEVTDSAGCGTVTTNEVSIDVLLPFNPGTAMSSDDVLCHGDTLVISGQGATGADGDIDDVWMVAIDGGPFEESDITSLEWTVDSSTNDYVIYLESTSGFGCGTINSNTVVIQTLPAVVPPSVDFVDYDLTPLCFGDDAPEIEVTMFTEGADGSWDYVWESSQDGEIWSESQSSSNNFNAGTLNTSTSFRISSESLFGCGTFNSNQLDIEVLEGLTSPSIELASSDFGICHNTSPGNMSLFLPASGGSGNWSYQWEVNANGNWSEVDGETGLQYTPSALTASQSFRIVATEAQCGVRNSSPLDIVVFDPLSESMGIATNDVLPLCDANNGVLITLDIMPTGGGDGFTYQWQEAGLDLGGQTDTDLAVTFLENSTSYQLVATSNEGCGNVPSNEIGVAVYDPLEIADAQGGQTICFMTDPEPLFSAGAVGGSSDYSYQWEENSGGDWVEMEEETETSVSPGILNASNSYRLRVDDNEGCGVVASAPVFVEVLSEFFPGTVQASDDELCFGENFTVSSAGGQGADGDVTNVWFVSVDGEAFEADLALSELQWTVENAGVDYDVYLESTSNFGCGTVVSESIHIEVLDSITSPQIAFDNYNGINLCYADEAPAVHVSSLATGADGDWSYSWQQSGTNSNWSDSQLNPEGFSAGALYDTLQIRILGTSDFGCGSYESNVLMVPVWEEVTPGAIDSSPEETICHLTEGTPLAASPAVGGGGVFDLQWMTFETASPFEIPDAQSLNLTPGILTDTTSYYLEYTNLNGCGSVVSNTIQISVLPALQSGDISGWDGQTLCFGESVSLAIDNVIDYPWLSHQWFVTDTADVQDALVNFQELSFADLTLTESTTFTVETTSDFGCGSIESESLEVTMWHNLEAPAIDFDDEFQEATLCYLDASPDFESTTAAFGGGGPLAYEWELQQGTAGSFEGTSVFSQAFYNPGQLTDTVVVRLRVTDEYGCGTLVSNSLTMNVYAPLTIAIQPDGQPICFGTSPIDLASVASGGGDDYTLQWHSSEDNTNFGALDNQSSTQVFNLPLEQDTWFYLDVASNEGCGVIQSDTVFVDVQDPLTPGAISLADNPICAEEQGALSSTIPQGGFNNFEYAWHVNIDGTWETQEEDGDSFVSTELLNNTFFYVSYSEDCGTVYSDTLDLVVNPLPVINPIVGASTPCYNSINQEYRIPNWDWTMQYAWNVDPDFGEITSGEAVDEILVNWGDQSGTTDVSVLVTNPETSCNDEFYFEVNITDVMAPPASIVVKKPGINLLVSADSTECAQHLWGVEDVLTGQVTYFPELNEQYAYFDDLDTLNFHYFVEVVYDCGDGPSCPTINYYNHDPFVGLEEVDEAMTKVFPNPVRGQLHVQSNHKIQSLNLFTLSGKVMQSSATFNAPIATLELSDFPSGLYLLELKLDGGLTEVHRIVVD